MAFLQLSLPAIAEMTKTRVRAQHFATVFEGTDRRMNENGGYFRNVGKIRERDRIEAYPAASCRVSSQ